MVLKYAGIPARDATSRDTRSLRQLGQFIVRSVQLGDIPLLEVLFPSSAQPSSSKETNHAPGPPSARWIKFFEWIASICSTPMPLQTKFVSFDEDPRKGRINNATRYKGWESSQHIQSVYDLRDEHRGAVSRPAAPCLDQT